MGLIQRIDRYTVEEQWRTRDDFAESDLLGTYAPCWLKAAQRHQKRHHPRHLGGHAVLIAWERRGNSWVGEEAAE